MEMTDDIQKKLRSLKGIGPGKINAWIKKLEEVQEEPAGEDAVPDDGDVLVERGVPVEGDDPIMRDAPAAGNASVVKDHRTQPNPYYSKWGPVEGEKRLRNSTAMNKYCCIKELVTHIVEQSEVLFKGTDHEGN